MSAVLCPISGGIDSTVLLHHAVKVRQFERVYPITFSYGQRHKKEIEFAKRTCEELSLDNHLIIDLDFFHKIITTSSIINRDMSIPKLRDVLGDAQPTSYVPFRNMMLLSIASAYAESVQADTVFHGAALIDSQSGYWDGSKEFMTSINNITSLNRKNRITIEAPLIDMSKGDIIQMGISLNIDFSNTWTCYEGLDKACGECASCGSRIKGFIDNRIKDPVEYSKDIPWNKYNCV